MTENGDSTVFDHQGNRARQMALAEEILEFEGYTDSVSDLAFELATLVIAAHKNGRQEAHAKEVYETLIVSENRREP